MKDPFKQCLGAAIRNAIRTRLRPRPQARAAAVAAAAATAAAVAAAMAAAAVTKLFILQRCGATVFSSCSFARQCRVSYSAPTACGQKNGKNVDVTSRARVRAACGVPQATVYSSGCTVSECSPGYKVVDGKCKGVNIRLLRVSHANKFMRVSPLLSCPLLSAPLLTSPHL